jgi:hypothetical protein
MTIKSNFDIVESFFKNNDTHEEIYIRFCGKPKVYKRVPFLMKLRNKREHGIPPIGKEKNWGIPDICKSKATYIEY